MSINPIVKVLIFASLFFITAKVYERKVGSKIIQTHYIDLTVDDYDDHHGGVSDIDMQTRADLTFKELPWALFETY